MLIVASFVIYILGSGYWLGISGFLPPLAGFVGGIILLFMPNDKKEEPREDYSDDNIYYNPTCEDAESRDLKPIARIKIIA